MAHRSPTFALRIDRIWGAGILRDVPDDAVRRGSPIPLYFQLQELLKEKIEAGVWSAGQMIPSEPELCATYHVSRTVVRQALSVLEQDGQLRRIRGRGTFVDTPKLEERVGGLIRLWDHSSPSRQLVVLDHREEDAPPRVRDQLELEVGAKILRVMTLLRVDEAPVALFDSFLPFAVIQPLKKRLQLHKKPPFVLSSEGPMRQVDLTHTTVRIETSFCSSWEAEQLQIPVQGAVFVTLCTEFARERGEPRPCEVVRGVYRVDRVQLRFDVATNGRLPTAMWQIAES